MTEKKMNIAVLYQGLLSWIVASQCSDCSVHHLEWVVVICLFLRSDRIFRSHLGLTLNDCYSLEYVLSLLSLTFCFYDKLTNTF